MSVQVVVHPEGVIEVCKSGGVRGIIEAEASAAAGRCNDMVRWHSPMEADAYVGVVDEGTYTAIGKVAMKRGLGKDGQAAQYYEAKHNVLLAGSGW